MSEWLPNLTTSTSVRALKDRLNATVLGLDAQVAKCSSLDPSKKAAWSAFKTNWDKYYTSDDSWWFGFGTAAIFSEGQAFEQQIITWQTDVNSECGASSGPALLVPSHDPSGKTSLFSTSTVVMLTLGGVALAGGLVFFAVQGFKMNPAVIAARKVVGR